MSEYIHLIILEDFISEICCPFKKVHRLYFLSVGFPKTAITSLRLPDKEAEGVASSMGEEAMVEANQASEVAI